MSRGPAVALVCVVAAALGYSVANVAAVPGVAPYYVGLGVTAIVALIGCAVIVIKEDEDA
jgi:hypothetical protein